MIRSCFSVFFFIVLCGNVSASTNPEILKSHEIAQNKKQFLEHHGYNNIQIRTSTATGLVEVDYSQSTVKRYILQLNAPKDLFHNTQFGDLQAQKLFGQKALRHYQSAVVNTLTEAKLIESVNYRSSSFEPTIAVTATNQQIDRLKKHPDIFKIEPDNVVSTSMHESLNIIDASSAWQGFNGQTSALTGEGVSVAIIDTGIDYTHPALGGCLGEACKVVGGYDFFYEDDDPMDVNGHGTHVAGTVAADSDTLKGVAPNATLYAYKVLGDQGFGYSSMIIAAIERSMDPDQDPTTDDAIDVINMSLGGSGNSQDATSRAVDRAVDAGIVVVVAAGNSGQYGDIEKTSPSAARKAITVGSSTKQDQMSIFTSKGSPALTGRLKPEIMAPGSAIESAKVGGGTIVLSGTSMAAPHVAGAAALLKQAFPQDTPDRVLRRLTSSAADLGLDPFVQGAGRLSLTTAHDTALSTNTGAVLFGQVDKSSSTFNTTADVVVYNDSQQPQQLSIAFLDSMPAGIEVTSSVSEFELAANSSTTVTFELNILDVASLTFPEHAASAYFANVLIASSSQQLTLPVVLENAIRLTIQNESEHLAWLTVGNKDNTIDVWELPIASNSSQVINAKQGEISLHYGYRFNNDNQFESLPSDAKIYQLTQHDISVVDDMTITLTDKGKQTFYGLSKDVVAEMQTNENKFNLNYQLATPGASYMLMLIDSVNPAYVGIKNIDSSSEIQMMFPSLSQEMYEGQPLNSVSLNAITHDASIDKTTLISNTDPIQHQHLIDFEWFSNKTKKEFADISMQAIVKSGFGSTVMNIPSNRFLFTQRNINMSDIGVRFNSYEHGVSTGLLHANQQGRMEVLDDFWNSKGVLDKGGKVSVGHGIYPSQWVNHTATSITIVQGQSFYQDMFGNSFSTSLRSDIELFCDDNSVYKDTVVLGKKIDFEEQNILCTPDHLRQQYHAPTMLNDGQLSSYNAHKQEQQNTISHTSILEKIGVYSADTAYATNRLDKLDSRIRLYTYVSDFDNYELSYQLDDGEWLSLETTNNIDSGYIEAKFPLQESIQNVSLRYSVFDGEYEFRDLLILGFDEDSDIDGDGIANRLDEDDDNDGVDDSSDFAPYDPFESYDTDGDGIGNNADEDDDNDGIPDENDDFPLDPTRSKDSDNDGLDDNEELSMGTNPFVSDSDGDLLLDGEEIAIGTNPLNQDTDGDRINDFVEIGRNSNPLIRLNSLKADFDNDGIDDFAVRRVSNNTTYIRNSSGTRTGSQLFGRQTTDIPLYGDFDGDGITDLVIRRPNNGYFYIQKSRSGQTSARLFGTKASDIPVLADYDGDGKTDLAIRRPSTGEWFILKSTTGRIVSKRFGMQSSDIAIPADFDGDGKADLAIRRAGTGEFFIKSSLTSTIERISFGTKSDDTPLAGDYDGDGKADLVIHRKTSTQYQWFIRESTTGLVRRFIVEHSGEKLTPLTGDFDGDGISDIAYRIDSTGNNLYMSSQAQQIEAVLFGQQSNDVPLNASVYAKMRSVAAANSADAISTSFFVTEGAKELDTNVLFDYSQYIDDYMLEHEVH